MKDIFYSGHELIASKPISTVELSRWRDGSSLIVSSQQQFDELTQWVQL